MKKNYIILFATIVLIVFVILLIFLNHSQDNYYIKVKAVDKNSPDVSLTVYENDKEIEVDAIYYKNDILLCSGNNLTTNKFNIKNNDQMKIVLKNKKETIAKVVMEE